MSNLKYKDIVTGDVVDLTGNNYTQMEKEAPKEMFEIIARLQMQVFTLTQQVAALTKKVGEKG